MSVERFCLPPHHQVAGMQSSKLLLELDIGMQSMVCGITELR